MATQRCRYSLTPSLLLIVGAVFVSSPFAHAGDGAPPAASRPLMRLPRWIESLSGKTANGKPARQPATESAAETAKPSLSPAASQPPQAPSTPDLPPPNADAIGRNDAADDENGGRPLEIASTPPESSAGMPGRALLGQTRRR